MAERRLRIVTSDEYIAAMRGPLKDIHGEPFMTENMSVMQFSKGGKLLAQAIYMREPGVPVRVRYELDPALLAVPAGGPR